MNPRKSIVALVITGLTGAGIAMDAEIVKMIDDILFSIVETLYALVPPE